MKHILIPALALSLAGCATMQTKLSQAGEALCRNAETLRASYTLMLINAPAIPDPVIQQSVIGVAQAGLAALANCPPAAPASPVQPAG